jgi:hypothetical protein
MNKGIDTVPIDDVMNRVSQFGNPFIYNPHHGLLAPSRAGKSYLIRRGIISQWPDDRTVLIDVKPGGERTWDGWGNDVTELKPGFGRGLDGTPHYRVMAMRGAKGKTQIRRMLEIIASEGSCILICDDSRKLTSKTPGFALDGYIDHILTEGAGIGITALMAANSTVWMTSSLRDQCGVYWVGPMKNEDQRKKFAEIIGLPNEHRRALGDLRPRQFLYADNYEGDLKLALTGI